MCDSDPGRRSGSLFTEGSRKPRCRCGGEATNGYCIARPSLARPCVPSCKTEDQTNGGRNSIRPASTQRCGHCIPSDVDTSSDSASAASPHSACLAAASSLSARRTTAAARHQIGTRLWQELAGCSGAPTRAPRLGDVSRSARYRHRGGRCGRCAAAAEKIRVGQTTAIRPRYPGRAGSAGGQTTGTL